MPLLVAVLLAMTLGAVGYRWASIRPAPHGDWDIRVPGRAWRWKNAPPLAYKILGCVFAINFLCMFMLLASISFWGATAPDVARTVPVTMRGGETYYATPVVGYYVKYAIPAGFAILGSMGVVAWSHRDELEAFVPHGNRAR